MEQRRVRRALALAVVALAMTTVTVAEAETVGYDPTKVLATLVTVTADATGTANASVTLPSEVTPGYEVIAAGIGPDDVRRSVLAAVTDDQSAAVSTGGEAQPLVLISASQTVDRTVRVQASGFKPLSAVTFSVRFTPAGATQSGGGGGGSLPFTGSNVGLLIAIAVAALLLGGPLTFGSRLARTPAGE